MIFLEIMVAFPQIDGATRFQMLAIESGSHWRNEDTRSGVEKDFGRRGFQKPVVVGHRHRIDIARRAGDRELVRESVDRLPVFWGEERSAIYRQFIGREFGKDPGGKPFSMKTLSSIISFRPATGSRKALRNSYACGPKSSHVAMGGRNSMSAR